MLKDRNWKLLRKKDGNTSAELDKKDKIVIDLKVNEINI
jgi:hypothetical protein